MMNSEQIFESFISEHERLNDWKDYLSRDGKKLSRNRIITECSFSRSILYQNRVINSRLERLEEELVQRGVIQHKFRVKQREDDSDLLNMFEEILVRLDQLDGEFAEVNAVFESFASGKILNEKS